jgi:hypothetical protein
VSGRVAARRRVPVGPLLVGALSAAAVLASLAGRSRISLAIILAIVAFGAAALIGRDALAWRTLLSFTIVVVMFVPIRRFAFAGGVGIQLEPYRLVVAGLAGCWCASLLVDPAVRLRRTGFEAPLAAFLLAIVASNVMNVGRIVDMQAGATVIKVISFMVSFVIVFYLVASLVREDRDVVALVDVLLVCGIVVATFAVVEAHTGLNVFDRLAQAIPGMVALPAEYIPPRFGQVRALASAQHPIALGALLALLLPFAAWRISRGHRLYGAAAACLLVIGTLSTLSRTAIVMMAVEVIVFVSLRPHAARRLWPLALPLLLAVHIALPGALGTVKDTFFPQGGIVKDQESAKGLQGQGRLADLSPTLDAWAEEPMLGRGFGVPHVQVLDDQWLGLLLDAGVVGVASLVWVFGRVLRRLNRGARSRGDDAADLLVALSASITAYAVGMLTFDTFSFIQVTFIFFVLLGLAASLLSRRPPPPLAVR